MIDVLEAIQIEEIDSYIDLKNKSLNETITLYNELIKNYKAFVTNYNKELESITDTLSKKMDLLYDNMNNFLNSYDTLVKKIDEAKKEVVESKEYSGNISKEINEKLILKLEQELARAKENVVRLIDSYIDDFKQSQKLLDKASSRLSRLRQKELKNIK